jgi:hypothetical protein
MRGVTNYSVEEICALLTTRPIPKDELLDLQFNLSLKSQVKETLNRAGYEFIDDHLSNHYDARIKRDIRNLDQIFDEEIGSMELTITAKAMVTILWCKLILPKFDYHFVMTHSDELILSEDQLYENYKEHIGSKTHLRRVLTILRQYGFIETVRGEGAYKAGPRLSTAIDSTIMYERVKGKMIDFLVREHDETHMKVKDTFDEQYKEMEGEIQNESAS